MKKKVEDKAIEVSILDQGEVEGPGVLFDVSKIKIVDIDDITPNEYNPKDQDTEEYKTVRRGIKEKGLRGVIYVRNRILADGATKPHYEIVDGEQRWRSCTDLGYKKVPIYNFEDMPLKEAQEMTTWFEAQVPFNELKLADLVKEVVQSGEEYSLPYSQEQIDEYLKMSDFSWESYKGEMLELEESNGVVHMEVDLEFLKKLKKWIAENEPKERGGDHKRKMIIVGTEKYKLLQDAMKVVRQAIETAMLQNDITDEGRALELICADFIGGADQTIENSEESIEVDPDWVSGETEASPDENKDKTADKYQH